LQTSFADNRTTSDSLFTKPARLRIKPASLSTSSADLQTSSAS